jgi:hypothetical protein
LGTEEQDDEELNQARRRFLRTAAYTAPLVVSAVTVQTAQAQAVSCGPPENCSPPHSGNPCNPPEAPCGPPWG